MISDGSHRGARVKQNWDKEAPGETVESAPNRSRSRVQIQITWELLYTHDISRLKITNDYKINNCPATSRNLSVEISHSTVAPNLMNIFNLDP